MKAMTSFLALLALGQGGASEADRLERACGIVHQAYPTLMLAVMAEGPMDCGDHDTGFIDCDANDTPEERARQARRLEIRQQQEAVFKTASDACRAWAADRGSPVLQENVASAIREARRVGLDLPPEVRD